MGRVEPQTLFTRKDAWVGGCFELSLILKGIDEDSLSRFLSKIWEWDFLHGWYLDVASEPIEEHRKTSNHPVDDSVYGIAKLGNGRKVACQVASFIDEGGGNVTVDIMLFMSALSRVYPTGAYPFEAPQGSWLSELNEWFADLGFFLFDEFEFQCGVVGHEVCMTIDTTEILRSGPPGRRWNGYLWFTEDELRWYPPNQFDSPSKF